MSDPSTEPRRPPAAALELRVLTGRHAGATVVLGSEDGASGPSSVSIGPGLDHDIVLSDAAGSATLSRKDSGWQWAEADFNDLLPGPSRWRWGSVSLALGPAGSNWQTLPERFDRASLGLGSFGDNGDAISPPQERSDQQQEAPQSEPAPSPEAIAEVGAPEGLVEPPKPRTKPKRVSGFTLVSAGVFAAILAGALLLKPQAVEPPPAAPPVAEPAPVPPDPAAMTELIAAAGFASQVKVTAQPDGRLRLSGVVPSEADLDRLLAKVSTLTRRIVQRIITQDEFMLRLRALQTDVPVPVTLQGAPIGRVLVVEDPALNIDEQALEAWVTRALPELVSFSVVPRTELAEIIAPVSLEPDPEPIAQALPDLPASEPPFPPLPVIRLVVGGDSPYVMLASGEKWLPGGRIGEWTLAAVEPAAFLIQDVRGRLVRSPR